MVVLGELKLIDIIGHILLERPGGLKKLACLINCSNTCRSKACASAKTAFKPLYDCINKKCMLDCAQGPTPKCKSCTTTKCAKELATCNANSC